ncbi:ceramidase-domain-containing protein [Bombardia bombarda]|uniref:Ceramidase-domain-containing protein n=1 Tax=Bombardia bombarda TaxID=252184 RepID=A0AA39X7C8_9PEZI|nr:ceramidase-domain-containing protein [Bombardia bombarda]
MAVASTFQIPYREARDGFWGEQTSTLNWCEEDYNITYYCAELVNTLTNVIFMWLGVRGIRNVLQYSHSPVFLLGFVGYVVVGLGSMAFHTSLKYSMQLADELPMIYTVCIMAYATFSYERSAKVRFLVGVAIVGLASFITIYYLHAKDPVFHQAAYAIITLASTFRTFYVMEYQLRPAMKKRSPYECDEHMRKMWKLSLTGILTFLAGFFLWNMDNIFCRYLLAAKNQMLLPWAVVLEAHGWWHILTGLAYHLILWRLWLTRCLDGSEDEFMLDWEPLRSIPHVLVREIESQAAQAQQQIGLVRTQLASKQREMRLSQLTRGEISTLPTDTPVYEGVGKMFVALSVPTLQDKLGGQMKDMETEVESLGKRLHYLETTAKNSQDHIERMLKGSAGQ